MDKQEIKELIQRYQDGAASADEQAKLLGWYNHYAKTKARAEFPMDIWFRQKSSLEAILGSAANDKSRVVKLWPRIVAAVAAVAFIVIGIYLFRSQTNPAAESHYANDIKPGTTGATLTLSSGKQIRLTDAVKGELAEEAGVVVTKTREGQVVYEIKGSSAEPDKVNTLSTAKGETYMLVLPDKSKVWLNAASSLTYAAALNSKGRRIVQLNGEAYFEVAKDKAHPFVVESKGQQVEVLGTHFNINSYPDESVTKTTLIEGSVLVRRAELVSGSPQKEVILKPDQQALLQAGKVVVADVNPDLYVAWKNNNFVFENNDIQYIMRQVERWYNVEVIYQSVPTEKFWGSVSRFDNISSVLNILESAGGVHFKLDGRKLYVNK